MASHKLSLILLMLLVAPSAAKKRLKAKVAALIVAVEDLKKNTGKSDIILKAGVATLRGAVEDLKNTGKSDIILLNGEDHNSPSECARVCSGTTGRGVTKWIGETFIHGTGFYVDVDMTGCGFTTVPTVTTAIEGTGHHWLALGTSSVYNTTNNTFRMYLYPNREGDEVAGNANDHKWNVEWVAVGQSC